MHARPKCKISPHPFWYLIRCCAHRNPHLVGSVAVAAEAVGDHVEALAAAPAAAAEVAVEAAVVVVAAAAALGEIFSSAFKCCVFL